VTAALCPALAGQAERALETELTRHAAALHDSALPGMAEAAAALERRVADAAALETPANRDARRRLVAQLRRAGAEACRTRLVQALREAVLEPAERLAAGPPAPDAAVAGLEQAARELRRLEAVSRGLGETGALVSGLKEAMPRLHALAAAPGGLARVEVARLAEILAGPDAAEALLGG
jgi:hypothetical protein